ncbi:MAG: TIM barrel protein [Actinobacteria bacterium]|nr:TIM barrel protein [Actinomycetota bacterium]
MKLGCSTLQYENAGISLFEAIKNIGAIGYRGVELTFGFGYISEQIPEFPKIEDLREVLYESNVKVGSFSTSLFWGYGKNKVKNNKKILERMADITVELGGDHLVVVTGPWPDDIDRGTAWNNMTENLSWAARMCAERGLKLALESVVTWPVRDSKTFLEMKEKVGDNFYTNIDPSNYGISGEDPVPVVRKLKNYVGGVHLKDAKFKGVIEEEVFAWMDALVKGIEGKSQKELTFKGAKPEFTPMGEGDVDFRSLLVVLKEVDYVGWCMVEYEGIYSGYYNDPVRASQDSFQYLEPIFGDLNA